jgi:hypothetical protein
MNVYPEYLPRNIVQKQKESSYDQLMALNSDPNINMIGVKDNLLKHKKDGHLLFQKTDDHWNDYGAFFGYQKIMEELSKDFPELKPQPVGNYAISISDKVGNMANTISIADIYPEHYVKLSLKEESKSIYGAKKGYKTNGVVSQNELETVYVNVDGEPLKCLIIRDSFTFAMMKYFNEHFRSIVYFHDEWKARLRKDIIEIEKPDIVIVIALETHFYHLLTNLSF